MVYGNTYCTRVSYLKWKLIMNCTVWLHSDDVTELMFHFYVLCWEEVPKHVCTYNICVFWYWTGHIQSSHVWFLTFPWVAGRGHVLFESFYTLYELYLLSLLGLFCSFDVKYFLGVFDFTLSRRKGTNKYINFVDPNYRFRFVFITSFFRQHDF